MERKEEEKEKKLNFIIRKTNLPFGNLYSKFDFLIMTKNSGGLAAMEDPPTDPLTGSSAMDLGWVRLSQTSCCTRLRLARLATKMQLKALSVQYRLLPTQSTARPSHVGAPLPAKQLVVLLALLLFMRVLKA